MRTFVASAKSADSRWHVIDANGQVLGRVATLAARLLQGKHKAIYTPFIDTGDHVVVVNAAQVKLTGRKEDQKLYRRHSGYRGRAARGARRGRAQAPADSPGRGGRPRHAAEDENGRRDVPEAEGVRRAPTIRTPRSSRRKSRSRKLCQHRILRNRSPQDVRRPRVPPTRHRHHHRQPSRVRQLLPDRDAAHEGAPSARAHRERREVRHPRHGAPAAA